MAVPAEIVKTYRHYEVPTGTRTFFPYASHEGELTYELAFAYAKAHFLDKINLRIKDLQSEMKRGDYLNLAPEGQKVLHQFVSNLGRLRSKANPPPDGWCHAAAKYILLKQPSRMENQNDQ
jgi:hypothetical protein